jgi:hypothetical protein
LWEYGAGPAGIPEYLFPRLSNVLQKWWQTLAVQLEHLAVTAATTLGGLSLALVAGLLLALLTIYVRPLRAVVLPAFAAFNGIPKLAIAPLFVTWFGLGAEPKVPLAFHGLFPIFASSATGLGEIEPDVLDLGPPGGGPSGGLSKGVSNALPYPWTRSRWRSRRSRADRASSSAETTDRLSHPLDTELTPPVFACLLSVTCSPWVSPSSSAERSLLGWRLSRRRKDRF